MPFHRVVVGVDSSEAGLAALRQALRLRDPEGELLALSVAETHLASQAGFGVREWHERLRADAHDARSAAERELAAAGGNGQTRVVDGHAAPELLAAAREERADLLAIGSHGGGRAAGIAFGRVATRVVHDAPCSVLVARPIANLDSYPSAITVGLDGSEPSAAAERVASDLAEAFGIELRRLWAAGGKPIATVPEGGERDERAPLEALVDAGRSCELLVVGSRGAHGLAALGSVAERVAHRATCSVLIVRPGADG